jgi:hypothetical protein
MGKGTSGRIKLTVFHSNPTTYIINISRSTTNSSLAKSNMKLPTQKGSSCIPDSFYKCLRPEVRSITRVPTIVDRIKPNEQPKPNYRTNTPLSRRELFIWKVFGGGDTFILNSKSGSPVAVFSIVSYINPENTRLADDVVLTQLTNLKSFV